MSHPGHSPRGEPNAAAPSLELAIEAETNVTAGLIIRNLTRQAGTVTVTHHPMPNQETGTRIEMAIGQHRWTAAATRPLASLNPTMVA